MDCQIYRADEIAEVVLVGSLDSSWTAYLSDRLDEVVRAGALEIRLDLAGVSYLSSNGIALLLRYHNQLRKIGGRIRVVADSDDVGYVLRLTGVYQILHDDGSTATRGPSATSRYVAQTLEREGMVLQVFPQATDGAAACLELIGDTMQLCGCGYSAADERTWMAIPGGAAFGLGALGPSFEACRGRFGEFLAVAGIAAYRPSGGPGRPDFEHAAGAFVPCVRLLYGLAFPISRPCVARFEPKGEPGGASATLSQIARVCLDVAGSGVVGIVLAGESDGLVGAALRRSPVDQTGGLDPFAHPQARDWLSFTPEPEHSRSTALVVGIAARQPNPVLAPFVRPLAGPHMDELQGHFHAAVVPYRPLAAGAIELTKTVKRLFEPGRIETILHLLGDSRAIVGAGESRFTRGVCWYVPLAAGQETGSP